MSSQKRGLGRGLGALLKTGFNEGSETDKNRVQEIALSVIVPNPFQPRKIFSDESISELAESIENNSLIQPVLLRKTEDKYQIVNGERRFRAFQKLNRETIPAIVTDINDQEMLVWAIVENIQRENLNPVEEAVSYQQLAGTFNLTHEQLASELGKSRSYISNSLRLLKLPKEILNYLETGLLPHGSARALLAIIDTDKQVKTALEAIHQGWNVRQVEKYVKDVIETEKNTNSSTNIETPPKNTTDGQLYEKKFQKILHPSCRYIDGKKIKKLEIFFADESEVLSFIEQFEKLS
jgi:ParB family chromosome partitioning protein